MAFFYDTYHNGIEVYINAGIEITIIVDEKGKWEVLTDYYDKRKNDSRYTAINAIKIGRIPYYNIVGYKVDGDEYYQNPHIYCKYSFDGSPFESVYYRRLGIARDKVFPHDFDKSNEVKFDK
ncbi:hypothetical protein GO755_29585 [Spirosoma sp. HMF4905]|uniref:Uncharacterized protein n=1 Tax=Spirosoma arboris TaxID=2682092 RepID=A0A7K1SK98_9BACT|nr:hypothetical protein [Spirosoma arboris]MVM34220.1 hypothetical protein [Spirosoma arboris]